MITRSWEATEATGHLASFPGGRGLSLAVHADFLQGPERGHMWLVFCPGMPALFLQLLVFLWFSFLKLRW